MFQTLHKYSSAAPGTPGSLARLPDGRFVLIQRSCWRCLALAKIPYFGHPASLDSIPFLALRLMASGLRFQSQIRGRRTRLLCPPMIYPPTILPDLACGSGPTWPLAGL
eukprot:1408983-Prymnesium_polylepis.1